MNDNQESNHAGIPLSPEEKAAIQNEWMKASGQPFLGHSAIHDFLGELCVVRLPARAANEALGLAAAPECVRLLGVEMRLHGNKSKFTLFPTEAPALALMHLLQKHLPADSSHNQNALIRWDTATRELEVQYKVRVGVSESKDRHCTTLRLLADSLGNSSLADLSARGGLGILADAALPDIRLVGEVFPDNSIVLVDKDSSDLARAFARQRERIPVVDAARAAVREALPRLPPVPAPLPGDASVRANILLSPSSGKIEVTREVRIPEHESRRITSAPAISAAQAQTEAAALKA